MSTDLRDWVERARRGEQSAYRALFDQYSGPVFRFAAHFTRDRDVAQDLTQEVFVTAFQKLDDLREPQAFRAWLFRIATTACHKHVRQRRRAAEQPLDNVEVLRFDDSELAEPLLRELKLEAVGQAIESLKNPRHREVVKLFYGSEDLTAREVGARLGLSVSTVTSTLSRVRTVLRKRALARLHEQAEAVGL